jgi:hypothetical protein
VTRHSVIALREEARRLLSAMAQCALDPEVDPIQRASLIRQMAADADDVMKALISLGGLTALETITT